MAVTLVPAGAPDEGSPCWTVVYLTAEEETKENFTMKSARMEDHKEEEEEKQD